MCSALKLVAGHALNLENNHLLISYKAQPKAGLSAFGELYGNSLRRVQESIS